MGVGYSVSPLHRIIYVGTSAMTARLHSPSVDEILAWRNGLTKKYRDQLKEELTWNENSTFETSEDVSTNADVMLHYVAAFLDQHGNTEISRLIEAGNPPRTDLEAALAGASHRGFGGRFPQLLLGAGAWLPYEGNMMIEEPNWQGHLARYGSVFHLIDELDTLRAALVDTHPSIVHSAGDGSSDEVLAAAWLALRTILRLAAVAADQHLPLWTTG